MIIDIGELHVISVFRVGELEYPIEIADGNGWWYAVFGSSSYVFDAALPVLPEDKDFVINILYDASLADAAQTLAESLPVLGLDVVSRAAGTSIDFSGMRAGYSLILQDTKDSSFSEANLVEINELKTAGDLVLFKYDATAPLIDTKHALNSTLLKFFSAIDERLPKAVWA